MPRFAKKYSRSTFKSGKSRRYKSPRTKFLKKGKFARFKKIRRARKSGRSKMSIAGEMAKVLPDQVYLNNYPDVVSVAGTANQKATQIMWAVQQLSSQTDSIQAAPTNLMPHDLTILQQILASQITSVATATARLAERPTAQLLVKSWKVSGRFTNLETGPIELIHYRCRARRDFSATGAASSLQDTVVNGFVDTNPLSNPYTGVTAQTLSTTYGATPFMNPRFTASVQVLRSKTYQLAPGRSIKLGYSLNKPRLWKNEDFNFGLAPDGDGSSLTARAILKGQHFSVFCLRGTFATNSANNAGYRTGVGNASVGIIYHHEIHYATITPQVMQASAMNALPGFAFGGAAYPLPIVATQPFSTINETSGARVLATTFPDTINDAEMTN